MQAQAGCTEYNAVRRPSIASSIFGVSTFKGLLSIPCDGRGARRPLGQSFRESVGPANVKLSGGTPHSTASQSRNGFEEKRVCGENEWTTAWSYKNRKTMAASSFKGHTIADALSRHKRSPGEIIQLTCPKLGQLKELGSGIRLTFRRKRQIGIFSMDYLCNASVPASKNLIARRRSAAVNLA